MCKTLIHIHYPNTSVQLHVTIYLQQKIHHLYKVYAICTCSETYVIAMRTKSTKVILRLLKSACVISPKPDTRAGTTFSYMCRLCFICPPGGTPLCVCPRHQGVHT